MIALPFLKSAAPPLQGERLYLRPPQLSDYRAWSTLRAQSREFLSPWEPLWAADDLERGAFRHRIRHYDEEAARQIRQALCRDLRQTLDQFFGRDCVPVEQHLPYNLSGPARGTFV